MSIKRACNGFFAALALSVFAFSAFSAQASQPQATQAEAADTQAIQAEPAAPDLRADSVTDNDPAPLATTCAELSCPRTMICKENCYSNGNPCCVNPPISLSE